MVTDLKTLRTHLKQQRAALSPWQLHQAAQRFAQRLKSHPRLKSAKTIALYWPVRGEADIRLIKSVLKPHQQVYLPILASHPPQTLRWVHWKPSTRFKYNRFNIPEPLPTDRLLTSPQLDCVLVPLVAFTLTGQRLGMGGGFYDRSFALLNRQPRPLKPYLIGVGYNFQQVPKLPKTSWDIDMNSIATETQIYSGF
jgi:5-formyltetrahydrofolate cyclo-ligase